MWIFLPDTALVLLKNFVCPTGGVIPIDMLLVTWLPFCYYKSLLYRQILLSDCNFYYRADYIFILSSLMRRVGASYFGVT